MEKYRIHWHAWLEKERLLLSRSDALMQLALLGVLTGLLAGASIVLFRFLVEEMQVLILPPVDSSYTSSHENFEGLATHWHFIFPVASGFLLAGLYYRYAKGQNVLGIAQVMERMAYHQGYLTLRGFCLQFVGAAIAIVGGHSIGREGPHVHLGAAAGSLLGQAFKLPNNCIRTMLACGVASGIAASFNTPLAGVIFALEVVMLEYTLASFIPIILSAGVATALSNAVFGSMPAFIVPSVVMASLSEIPIVLFLGLVIGTSSALMTFSIQRIVIGAKGIAIWWKLIAAGLITGFIGLLQPEILGIGYDTLTKTLLGQFSLGMLLGMTVMKMIATAFCVSLGVPGGVIGPGFFIGATLGASVGILVGEYTGATESFIGFYALLGMGAMVAAMLQAPLTALIAIVELTYNPGIAMPAMLAIVVAQLTASQIFNQSSLFISLLRANGLDYDANPMLQALRRVGVASVMDNAFVRRKNEISRVEAESLVSMDIKWIIISRSNKVAMLMPLIELAKYLQSEAEVEEIDLLAIPASHRRELTHISLQSSLQQAHDKLQQGAEALYVVFSEQHAHENTRIYGVLTRSMVESAYRY